MLIRLSRREQRNRLRAEQATRPSVTPSTPQHMSPGASLIKTSGASEHKRDISCKRGHTHFSKALALNTYFSPKIVQQCLLIQAFSRFHIATVNMNWEQHTQNPKSCQNSFREKIQYFMLKLQSHCIRYNITPTFFPELILCSNWHCHRILEIRDHIAPMPLDTQSKFIKIVRLGCIHQL